MQFKLKERAAGFFSLPKEVALDLPLLTATGRGELSIENYRNLLEFSAEKIRIRTRDGVVVVTGEGLALGQITTENVIVKGKISGVLFHDA
ncbi:MAG: YabP/YqfC family sporulation protein [Defluviitaleaceae bacterium]|nr:YabP/YqfC family sporulation protein [Defluviitaleaceae bacterium]